MSCDKSPIEAKKAIQTAFGKVSIFHLGSLKQVGIKVRTHLPFCIKVLLENALRNYDGLRITLDDVEKIANWSL